MRIVNLETFRKLHNGTLYSKYMPCCFDDLCIKRDTWEHDFLYQSLIGNIKADNCDEYDEQSTKAQNGESVALDFDCVARDGLFEKDQLFAVYEPDDLFKLIRSLMKCEGVVK